MSPTVYHPYCPHPSRPAVYETQTVAIWIETRENRVFHEDASMKVAQKGRKVRAPEDDRVHANVRSVSWYYNRCTNGVSSR